MKTEWHMMALTDPRVIHAYNVIMRPHSQPCENMLLWQIVITHLVGGALFQNDY